MTEIQKLPKRAAKKKHTGLALALILLALLLVAGGVMMYRATVAPAEQAVIDTMRTQRAEAGETAVQGFWLTQTASR